MSKLQENAKAVADRIFWPYVTKTENCWIFIYKLAGPKQDKRGYVQWWKKNGKQFSMRASRFSYILHFDKIENGLFVLHRCDNGLCIRPDHLFLGTQQDNVNDMIAKGRKYYFKLTWEKVRKIREEYATGCTSYRILAKKYNITFSVIADIINNRAWRIDRDPSN